MMNFERNPSEFKDLKEVEYFKFEEDFIEENVRCIPMIVRFKMDEVGIKLKLAAWSKFPAGDRLTLAMLPLTSAQQKKEYRDFLIELIAKYTRNKADELTIDQFPAWRNIHQVPLMLVEKSAEFDLNISISQWNGLSELQRFALLKLCRPGHENKNFYKAAREFGLLKD